MKEILEKNYDLRPSDFNCYGQLLPSAVLDIFQDAAGRHSIKMGASIFDLEKKGLIWVVAKTRLQFVGSAEMYQEVKVKTWPLKPTKVVCTRECLMTDLNGNEIVKGSSEWIVVDKVKRKIMPCEGIYKLNDEAYLETKLFEEKISKIHTKQSFDNEKKIMPRFSDIDVNGHVNNAKYADLLFDSVSSEKPAKDFKYLQIEYHKEVLKDRELNICFKNDNGQIIAVGKDETDKIMFSAIIR